MQPKRMTSIQMKAAVEKFNRTHAIGDTIHFRPVHGESHTREVTITAPGAHVLSGHTAVVQVSGGHGCVALSHVVTGTKTARMATVD